MFQFHFMENEKDTEEEGEYSGQGEERGKLGAPGQEPGRELKGKERLSHWKCGNGLELLLSLPSVHHCYHCPLKF